MSLRRFLPVSCLLLLSVTASAFAQTDHRVGLVMGVPVQVGVLWHASERVAVRPDVSFSRTSSEFDASLPLGGVAYTSSVGSTRVTTGVSLLFNVTDEGDLRTYVAPRYGFSRSSSSSASDVSGPGGLGGLSDASRSTQATHSVGGLFGAHYALGSRFALFGEVGLDFSTSSTTSALVETRSTGRSAGTRGGAGVVLYF